MKTEVRHAVSLHSWMTDERCTIAEIANTPDDPAVSIARATVAPGVTTAWHALDGVDERYLIVAGEGCAEIGDMPARPVAPGDVVKIAAGVRQRIANTGTHCDLVFYAICSPRFTPACYIRLE